MEGSASSSPPPAACAQDEGRLRELVEALAREKEAHRRMDAACEESRKVIHALNNALSIIATFAATLADEVAGDEQLRDTVEEIVRASKTAGMLSRKLGDLQREAQEIDSPDQGRA